LDEKSRLTLHAAGVDRVRYGVVNGGVPRSVRRECVGADGAETGTGTAAGG
jgi:hypothetical protein